MAAVSEVMLLMNGTESVASTDYSLHTNFGIQQAEAMQNETKNGYKVSMPTTQVAREMIASSGKSGPMVNITNATW